MTQRIIKCILFLVIVSPGLNLCIAGQTHPSNTGTELHISKTQPQALQNQSHHSKMPVSSAHHNDAPHGKAVKVPHMEELPHIHRYHKERVKKMKAHHSKYWMLAKVVVVLCHLSLLWIAYMHITH